METKILFKLFESLGIQDILPKIQVYVDEYNNMFKEEGIEYALDKINKDIDKVNNIKHELSNRRTMLRDILCHYHHNVNPDYQIQHDMWMKDKRRIMKKWYDDKEPHEITFIIPCFNKCTK